MSELSDNVATAFRLCNEQRERIAQLEAQLAKAQATVERLSAPVNEEEWIDEAGFEEDAEFYLPKKSFNRIIKARLAPPTPQAAKDGE